MPTCLVYSRPLLSSSRCLGRDTVLVADGAVCYYGRKRFLRAASTATATAIKQEVASSANTQHRVLTVLHKTKSLLPRILPSKSVEPADGNSLEFWDGVLGRAYDDLCPSPAAKGEDKVRVVVYGCDELSGAQELVTALLEDPFASDAQKDLIHARWRKPQAVEGAVRIQYGSSAQDDPDSVHIQSSWLQRFGAPLQILEIGPPRSKFPVPFHLEDLVTADIPIIVCNPVSTPLSTILSTSAHSAFPLDHPNAILILSYTSATTKLAERLRSLYTRELNILCIDPSRALSALGTLSLAPSSPRAIQTYQDDFAGSNISRLTEAVSTVVSSAGHALPSAEVISALHLQTAEAVVHDALSTCTSVLSQAHNEVNEVCTATSSLRGKMAELRVKVNREVFGDSEGGDEVKDALKQSRKDIKAVTNSLTWWKLPWKVDDVGEIITTAVDRAWCRDLEYKLVFQAGRLALIQQSFTDSANSLLASFPPRSPFQSPLLRNRLSQIAASPSFSMDASSLLQPLHTRRQQLRFPTARLQTTAQRAVLGMGGSVFGGLGVAWAGWAGQLGIFDIAMQFETAVGVGMLGAVAGIRWAVGRFERAKTKWWKDHDRVGEGLERDLKAALDHTINKRVIAVSEEACSGLDLLVSKRKEEIEDLKEEVTLIEEELEQSSS